MDWVIFHAGHGLRHRLKGFDSQAWPASGYRGGIYCSQCRRPLGRLGGCWCSFERILATRSVAERSVSEKAIHKKAAARSRLADEHRILCRRERCGLLPGHDQRPAEVFILAYRQEEHRQWPRSSRCGEWKAAAGGRRQHVIARSGRLHFRGQHFRPALPDGREIQHRGLCNHSRCRAEPLHSSAIAQPSPEEFGWSRPR